MNAVCILGSPNPQGSTAAVVSEITRALAGRGIRTQTFRIGEMDIRYCKGCKACEATGACPQADDVAGIAQAVHEAGLVILASPSYWGDITGQMKVLFDRFTPYSDTNPARLGWACGAKGLAVALRAGPGKEETLQLVETMGHFFGHIGIPLLTHFTVEGINTRADLDKRPAVLRDAHAFGEAAARLLI